MTNEKILIRRKKEMIKRREINNTIIIPNDKVEEIDTNPFMEPVDSKKALDFPLKDCSKFSDNRIFLFKYFQYSYAKSNKRIE
jgi:uncharacterized protein with PIN domain